ncbi:MAG: glutamate-1-semialdehyde 2,1-aminomutase [Deltaproteobacteria bacterium]
MGAKSRRLFQEARTLIPGGVNSPVRAGKAVGMDPPFISRAKGCHLWDVDRKRYVDYVCSWGPMILGHSHPGVVKALQERAPKGTSYGAPTELEVEMARKIVSMVPSIEMVRMVNSGTEATMSAVRLARGFTCREKIIKFEGCYHGHADSLLVSAGSGVATFAIPGCPGVPADLAGHTISLPFNSLDAVVQTMENYGPQIAAIIVEPVPGNMGVVLPKPGFLKGLRGLTANYGSLLIFDEVISGFRVGPGGAQALYGITPDLTCLGKIIGGGLPVGAYGGKKSIMQSMAPEGNIYQAGTLSGNPLAMAAGLATLKELEKGKIYQTLEQKGKMLFTGLEEAAKSAGVDVVVNWIGSMGTLFFTKEAVTDFDSAKKGDQQLFRSFYAGMLEQGIYLAPSAYEAWFVSAAHDSGSLQKTIQCAERSFASLKKRKIH